MFARQGMSPLLQFGILCMLCGAGIVLGAGVTGVITPVFTGSSAINLEEALLKAENAGFAKVVQLISTIFLLGIPAIAFSLIVWKSPLQTMGFTSNISGKQFFLAVLFVFAGLLVGGGLGTLNKAIPLPADMAAYFQQLEDDYNSQVLALSHMQTTADYVFALFILGLMPAIFEEMFFRGCLQQVMVSLFRNALAGILVTSIFFSAIHLSFYGFLPRLFLGLMLGYIFYYSKNLWLSIAVHFLNNAIAVTQMYVLGRQGKLTTEAMDETFPLYYGALGIAVVIALFYTFKNESELVISMKNMEVYRSDKSENT